MLCLLGQVALLEFVSFGESGKYYSSDLFNLFILNLFSFVYMYFIDRSTTLATKLYIYLRVIIICIHDSVQIKSYT